MKRTPLYETHAALHGKLIEFGGWEMPVEYTGILEEHAAVRRSAGLFDVSHMGEILVDGPGAQAFVQVLVTNDISGAKEGRCIYSPMCRPEGGVVDDLLIYVLPGGRFLLVVNAANTQKDFDWLLSHRPRDARAENVSDSYAQLALQGPLAQAVLQKLTSADLGSLKFYHFLPRAEVAGVPVLLSRTGYTGEDGFELYLSPGKAVEIWQKLLDAGSGENVLPAGLGARDTLRLEAALPLYGHELSDSISPLEAGLSKFVKFEKADFIGREALLRQKENGIPRQLIGFLLGDRGIARSGCEVFAGGRKAGRVTSGSYSPSLRKGIGMALVDSGLSPENLTVSIRGRQAAASPVPMPFYKKNYKQK